MNILKISNSKIRLITSGMALAGLYLAANAADNTANIAVTASVPYLVGISDYQADFTVSDYTTADTGNGAEAWSIWTNAPGTITVTVATTQADATHAYMQNTAYTAADGQNKVPYKILYQPCGDFGVPIDITPYNGQTQFQLASANANQATCAQNPGVIMVMRPAMLDVGPPLAGSYTGTTIVTVQEPAGVSGGQSLN